MADYENQNQSEHKENSWQPSDSQGQSSERSTQEQGLENLPDSGYGDSPQPPHNGQNPYAGQPQDNRQNPYSGQPQNNGQNPYAGQPQNNGQNPYAGQPQNNGQNPYGGQPQNNWQDPYSGQPQNNGQNPYGGQPQNNWQDPYSGQPQNNGQNPYAGQPQNNGQNSYGGQLQNNGQNSYGGQPQWNQTPYGNQPQNWNSFDARNDGSGDPYNSPRPPKQKNGFATAALVTGIFGILTLCCCAFPLSIIMGVGAISFAVISKKGQPFTGFAIAGIILGVICIIGGVAEFIYVMAISSLMRDPEYAAMFNQIYEQMQQIQSGQ